MDIKLPLWLVRCAPRSPGLTVLVAGGPTGDAVCKAWDLGSCGFRGGGGESIECELPGFPENRRTPQIKSEAVKAPLTPRSVNGGLPIRGCTPALVIVSRIAPGAACRPHGSYWLNEITQDIPLPYKSKCRDLLRARSRSPGHDR